MQTVVTIRDLIVFYAGLSFLAICYWLIVYIYSKRVNYIVLVAATMTHVLFNFNLYGIALNFKNADLVLLAGATTAFCLLASKLNGFRKYLSPPAFLLFTSITVMLVLFQATSPYFLRQDIAILLSYVFTTGWVLCVTFIFFYLWIKKKLQTARFAFISYLPGMAGFIILALTKINVLPGKFKIASIIGSALFTIILFYGMVRYIMALREKREKEHLEKKAIIEQQNILLEKKVEERTRELEMEKARSEELLIHASAKQMAELELQSLRAQLNPHFIFNSLNAIQELILKKDFKNAHAYLTRFARLLRMLLENSERPFTSLQKEIEFVELYLSLEKLRIPDMQVSVSLDPRIKKEETFIPTMILQPYIENALWHGLSHKNKNRKLELKIRKQNGWVTYDVKDNGVGRKKAAELKSEYRKAHKSRGTELLAKRFKLLNEEFGSLIKTDITDIMAGNEPAGTKVCIRVPDTFTEHFKNRQA